MWPEFGQAGKAAATIGQIMCHQVGLPGFAEPTTLHDLCDWNLCCDRLARQTPAWPPGTATSYHALTYGWLAGEAIARAAIPAANGHASALGLARLYGMLVNGGELDGVRILSADAVSRMTAPASASQRRDLLLGFTDCWALGVALNAAGIYGPNPRAFGHSGWGGSFGCADPASGIAIGYVCNQMGPDLVGDPRTLRLCESVFMRSCG